MTPEERPLDIMANHRKLRVAALCLVCSLSVMSCGNTFNRQASEIDRASPVPSNSVQVVPRCKPIQYESPSDDKTCYELQEKLITSINNRDLNGIREALKTGASVEAGYADSYPPLHTASLSGFKDAVVVLLDFGADPNRILTFGKTPLNFATYYGHKEIVQVLLERGAKVCLTVKNDDGKLVGALDKARAQGFPEIEEILLKAGAGQCSD